VTRREARIRVPRSKESMSLVLSKAAVSAAMSMPSTIPGGVTITKCAKIETVQGAGEGGES